jgi:protein TonB
MNQATAPAPQRAKISANDRLGFTLFVAIAFHLIIILGVGFTQSDANQIEALPSLEVILANTSSPEQPEDPDFLAQDNQKGGGTLEDKARPSAPVSAPTPIDQNGLSQRSQPQRRAQKLKIENIYYINQRESERRIAQAKRKLRNTQQKQSTDTVELQRMEIASLRAEIRKMSENYSKRPREIALTANTKRAVEAGYLAQWVQRIEHIGNLNYPAEAEVRKISGSLRVNVRINALGEVIDVRISKPSGETVLDQAARRIVRLAQPFAPFPEELRERADQIVIVRTWEFNSNKLTTGNES